MNRKNVCFVVVTFKPDKEVLRRLVAALEGWSVEIIDNTKKNIGYGGGANKGMKRAFDAGAAWAIVCNQDIELTRAGVLKLTKELEECSPGIVGPEAGELDPKRWTTIVPSSGPTDYISGSLMAIHRDVYETTGGFFEPYFMYYEDADISLRAKKAGFELRQVKIDGFGHETHGSPGKNYYLARNHLLFVLRNAPWQVKIHELVRLPKTLFDFIRHSKNL